MQCFCIKHVRTTKFDVNTLQCKFGLALYSSKQSYLEMQELFALQRELIDTLNRKAKRLPKEAILEISEILKRYES